MSAFMQEMESWIAVNREGLTKSLEESENPDVVMLRKLMPTTCIRLWDSGCWLKHKLIELGCTEELARQGCFVHGQRSCYSDPYGVAVAYADEFERTHKISDEPGIELAARLHNESLNG